MTMKRVSFPVTITAVAGTATWRFRTIIVKDNDLATATQIEQYESISNASVPITKSYDYDYDDSQAGSYKIYTYSERLEAGIYVLKNNAEIAWIVTDRVDTIDLSHRVENVKLAKAVLIGNPTNRLATQGDDILAPNGFEIWDRYYPDTVNGLNDNPLPLYMKWNDNATNETAYRIYEAIKSGSSYGAFSLLYTEAANTTVKLTGNHARNTVKQYIQAYKSGTNTVSPPSEIKEHLVGSTLPKAPTNLTVTDLGSGFVRLNWTNPIDNPYLDYYYIYGRDASTSMNTDENPISNAVTTVDINTVTQLNGIQYGVNGFQIFLRGLNEHPDPFLGLRYGFYSNPAM